VHRQTKPHIAWVRAEFTHAARNVLAWMVARPERSFC
jgi:hypothetical protein